MPGGDQDRHVFGQRLDQGLELEQLIRCQPLNRFIEQQQAGVCRIAWAIATLRFKPTESVSIGASSTRDNSRRMAARSTRLRFSAPLKPRTAAMKLSTPLTDIV